MTHSDQISALAADVGTEIKAVRAEVTAGSVTLQAAIDSVSNVVATKASVSDLNAAAGVLLGSISDLSDVVATKATQSNVDSQLAGKANAADLDNVFVIANDALVTADAAVPQTRTVAGKSLTANITLVKGDIGLGNVDNTSDANKPVSTAQQTALDLKAPLASPAFTGTPTGITKTHVGLGSVDNTADSAKPVSTAQAAAIATKVNTADVAALNTVGWGRAVFIPNGGTVPVGTPPYTIVIEASA